MEPPQTTMTGGNGGGAETMRVATIFCVRHPARRFWAWRNTERLPGAGRAGV